MKLETSIIDEAYRQIEQGLNSYTCHAIRDAIRASPDVPDMMADHYLTAYTKFSGNRLGIPVDVEDSHSLNPDYGMEWKWWCSCSRNLEDRLENLQLFKAAIENGEVE